MIGEARSLTVKTPEGKTLLEDINLEVKEGETLLICGKPGSGKTTLCKAFKGILPENFEISGSVKIEGKSGFLFQSPEKQIVREKVIGDLAFGLENEGIPPEEIKKRIEKYIEKSNSKKLLFRKTKNLSSGEMAKVALIGVLVTEPDVLILDEPLSMLDASNKKRMINQIEKIKDAGKTLIISNHKIKDLLSTADRTVILKDGKMKNEGKPEELLSDLRSEGLRLPFELELKLESEKSDSN